MISDSEFSELGCQFELDPIYNYSKLKFSQ